MKIIQIIPSFCTGGAEIMCENLCRELKNAGHQVIPVSMYSKKTAISSRLEKEGFDVRYLGKKRGFRPSMIFKISKLLKQENPDVLHAHTGAAQYAFLATIFHKIKAKVYTVHSLANYELNKVSRLLNKIAFKRLNVTPVALSKIIKDSVTRLYKLKDQDVPIVFNGINLDDCLVKTDYSINGNFKILHIGKFREEKNHEGLIDAFKKFSQVHPDSQLDLIGDGVRLEQIKEYVSKQGLTDSVNFLLQQDDVYPILEKADIFALSSNYEGMPLTLIEAMGTAVPIVATRVGGIPDMLTDNFNAFLVDVNSQALCDAFCKYYDSEDLRSHFGKRAKERSEDFSATLMAKRYVEIYQEKIEGKR